MKRLYFLTAATFSILSGCASGPTPQNAQEFRQTISKGVYGSQFETYEVSGSYSKVAATLSSKTRECLNRAITVQQCIGSSTGTSCFNHEHTFIPHVKVNPNSTEIVVQVKINPDNNVYIGGRPPESGMYIAVADVVPAGGKTKISMYGASISMYAHIPRAIKMWANGTNLGCPDLTADL